MIGAEKPVHTVAAPIRTWVTNRAITTSEGHRKPGSRALFDQAAVAAAITSNPTRAAAILCDIWTMDGTPSGSTLPLHSGHVAHADP